MPCKKTHHQKNIAKSQGLRWAAKDLGEDSDESIAHLNMPEAEHSLALLLTDHFSSLKKQRTVGMVEFKFQILRMISLPNLQGKALMKKAWWNLKAKSWSRI